MVLPILMRGLARTRWRRYALLATAFFVGVLGFFAVVSFAVGTQEAVIRPMEATLTGDVRVTRGSDDLAAGDTWTDYRPVAAQLDRVPHAHASPRVESSYISVRGQAFANWSAGLLLGVDPDDPMEASSLDAFLVWGHGVDSIDVFDPETNRAYTPLVLGQPAFERLNLTAHEDGSPLYDQVLTLTSGRTVGEGSVPVPITVDCVVVGVFETGLEPLDRFTAYVPIQAARALMGQGENDPTANAIVVRGVDAGALEGVAEEQGLMSQSSRAFAFGYMGSMLVIVFAAGALALGIFLVVLLTLLVHETAVLVRVDEPVISSLRAIGVSPRDIHGSYALLLSLAVGAGAVVAGATMGILAAVAPPLPLRLEGIDATVELGLSLPAVALVLALVTVSVGLAAFLTARRVQALNILDGLRGR